MSARSLLTALRSKDYHEANEAFAQTMQQKLAEALAIERQRVYSEEVGIPKPEVVPIEDIQRVFDEIHDFIETQVLCNINGLRVNDHGEVYGFTWN